MLLLCNDCCGCTGQICVTVRATGCKATGDGVAGATVTITQGAVTVGSCVTATNGTCCISLAAASSGGGTYTIDVVPPSGSCLNSKTTTGVSAGCNSTTNVTVSLTVQSGCQCTSCCPYPVNENLTLTDAGGSLDFDFTAPAVLWNACHMITGQVCSTTLDCGGRTLLLPVSGDTCVHYELECSAGEWTLRARWGYVEYWQSCTLNGDGSVTFSNLGYAWTVGSTTGDPCACGYGSCSGFFDDYLVDDEATVGDGSLVITCENGTFSGTATLPSSITSPGGLTVSAPHGGTVTFSL